VAIGCTVYSIDASVETGKGLFDAQVQRSDASHLHVGCVIWQTQLTRLIASPCNDAPICENRHCLRFRVQGLGVLESPLFEV
jgi:deoxycytidylate deaminase